MGSHFGVGAPPILIYFSGDWDVHWGYGVLTHSRINWSGDLFQPSSIEHIPAEGQRCSIEFTNFHHQDMDRTFAPWCYLPGQPILGPAIFDHRNRLLNPFRATRIGGLGGGVLRHPDGSRRKRHSHGLPIGSDAMPGWVSPTSFPRKGK